MKKLLLTLLTVILAINAAGIIPAAAFDTVPEIRRSASSTTDTRRVTRGQSFDIVINVFDASFLVDIFTLVSMDNSDLVLTASDINVPSSIAANRSYRFTFKVPDNAARRQDITYTISYSYMDEDTGMMSGSRTFSVPVEVTDSTASASAPLLENIKVNGLNISGEIFVTEKVTNAELTINRGSTQLAREYLNVVNATDKGFPFSLDVTALNTADNTPLVVTLTYVNSSGTSQTVSKNIPVSAFGSSAAPPTLENLIVIQNEVFAEDAFDLNVDIFPGGDKITGAVLTVNHGANQLVRKFIGALDAGFSLAEAVKISGIDTVGNQVLTVTLEYRDSAGINHVISKNVTVNVQPTRADSGLLNLQNLSAPFRGELDSRENMSFSLTNPTSSAISGIEAFLYDDGGKEITSIYISEIKSNSSETFTLSFPVTGRTGSRSYSLNITYRDAANTKRSINSSFSINVTAGEDNERAAGIRIQSINTPAQTNTGVRTNIPFTLVNAGRGTAYNVEVYVLDEQGVELAREFVGNIPAGGSSFDTSFRLRFDDPDIYNLTFYAVSESADETLSQVSRAFELRVVNYRITFADVGGHEWIWNNMTTIEFALINGGNEEMLNVNAELTDAKGNVFGQAYIGSVLPGEKKERVRFRDVFIWDDGMGFMELFIKLTYENKEMQEFPVYHSLNATFSSDGGWVDPPWSDNWGDDWEFEEESDTVWLVILIVSISVLLVGGIITFVVIRAKKKTRDEDDDIDYFLSQMKTDNASAEAKEEITQ
ncbi:MAG: hypothetical protein FWD48_01520 [Oscillospiraceae bacterium]|nr:hypothetical protein [Oscillospiraceae bacterium]